MRKLAAAMSIVLLFGTAVGFAGIDEKALMSDTEPGPFRGPVADTYSGVLDATSPTWDRIYGGAVDPACNASVSDSSSDGQYYEVIPIQVTANEDLECEVHSGDITDTVIALYCDPFDPANPANNVVAYDDDDGAGNLSAFLATDNITLSPGNTYYLVVSTYSGGVTGSFTVDFTSATVVVVPVELQGFSIE